MNAVPLAAPPPPTSDASPSAARGARVAFLLSDLNGGGVQRIVMILAGALAERGAQVDLVVCDARGNLVSQLPRGVRLVGLERGNPLAARLAVLRAGARGLLALARPVLALRHASKTLPYMPALAAYLRRARPDALFAAMPYLNIEAVLARRLAGGTATTRLVVSERTHFSCGKPRKVWRGRHLAAAMRWAYAQADAIVAVSNGVADDLAAATGIPREAITTLHNPTITPDFGARLAEPVDHPWFAGGDGAPLPVPVVLGVGRLGPQKDFPTLLRAFARLRRERPARLVIMGGVRPDKGGGERLDAFYGLAAQLGVRDDVDLIGYRPNPLPYMARAAVFALSSRFEGFPNVLLEALACGTPVVSTDCPSGPAEILDGGACGALVPVGDDAALAAAIGAALDDPPDPARLKARAAVFDYDTAIARYEEVLLGRAAETRPPAASGLGSRTAGGTSTPPPAHPRYSARWRTTPEAT